MRRQPVTLSLVWHRFHENLFVRMDQVHCDREHLFACCVLLVNQFRSYMLGLMWHCEIHDAGATRDVERDVDAMSAPAATIAADDDGCTPQRPSRPGRDQIGCCPAAGV